MSSNLTVPTNSFPGFTVDAAAAPSGPPICLTGPCSAPNAAVATMAAPAIRYMPAGSTRRAGPKRPAKPGPCRIDASISTLETRPRSVASILCFAPTCTFHPSDGDAHQGQDGGDAAGVLQPGDRSDPDAEDEGRDEDHPVAPADFPGAELILIRSHHEMVAGCDPRRTTRRREPSSSACSCTAAASSKPTAERADHVCRQLGSGHRSRRFS